MSIHSALQKFPAPSLHQLEKSIDGNLCRCTGYRPIVDALRYTLPSSVFQLQAPPSAS
jgi:xanthine dehydrogenase/oxidase